MPLQLVDCLLESLLSLFEVFLGLVSLLLEESELALPKCLLFVKLVGLVLKLTFHVGALFA